MSKSSLIRVFVYGTLKRGEPNHHWLSSTENGYQKFIATGTTVEKFPLVVGTRYNIPFLLNKKGCGNNISGEVYEVDDKMFAKLDILEDYPEYYDREIQEIETEQEGILHCWLYIIRSFPESLLGKKLLTSYANTAELPYCESYVESSKDDMYVDVDVQAELNTIKIK